MQGTILASRYRVIEYIAKGGFGKTYLAEDTQLPGKDKCVVKQLYPSVDNPNFIKVARRLFKTEAQTLNVVGSHDQIPRLMAYFEEDEKFYLIQQYIEGHTLSKELVSGEPWSEDRAIELLKDCLNILGFIHAKGVIHRDVKPDNLIRRQSDRRLVLVDFGTVKEVIAEQTQLIPATVAVGTRGYMPTEQALGKPRITSDIYALGIIAIQALTGVHPTELEENDNGEIIWQDLAPCSDRLKAIVAQMTRYHFKERYQSATEAIAALDDLDLELQEAADAQTEVAEVAEYTPTVRLSISQLASMSEQPQASSVQPQSIAKNSSLLATPNNLTFAPEPPESLKTNARQSEFIERSPFLENRSSSIIKTQKSSKTLITLGVAIAVGAIASGGMYLFNRQSTRSAQNSIAEQVDSFNAMLEQQDYQGCYQKAVEMSDRATDEAHLMPKEQQQEFEAKCGLGTAQKEAKLEYGAALEIAKTLPRNTSIDAEIQQQVDSWSEQLLAKATKIYEQKGNLTEAIETVNQIPQDSSVSSQVINAKNAWKAEFDANQALITSAEKALSEEKWQYAKQQATKVESSPSMYWQQQAKAIISQAEAGIAESTPPEVAAPSAPIDPIPTPTKVTKPDPAPATTPKPKAVTNPEPKPEPTTRIDQDSSEPLRDLGGNSESLPGIPTNPTNPANPANPAPQDDTPLRDL